MNALFEMDEDEENREIAIPLQTLLGNSTYELVVTGELDFDHEHKLMIVGTLGVAALTGFKITGAANKDGQHVNILVDADFNTATVRCPQATANIYTLASGNSFLIWLDCSGMREIKIYAKSAGAATLALQIGK